MKPPPAAAPTARGRFADVLNGRRPADRLPLVEWAPWWDLTLARWQAEDPSLTGLSGLGLQERFGLDPMVCLDAAPRLPPGDLPRDAADYEKLRPRLFAQEIIEDVKDAAAALRERHRRGELIVRLWLDGFFWFPRRLLGIERHLFAFHDEPRLMRRMNEDLADFNLRVVQELFPLLTPDMAGFAEDMSCKHGPMISATAFREFLAPFYRLTVPAIRARGTHVLVDSDGDVTALLPWLESVGVEGVYPLERQAGTDLARLRRRHPAFLFLGGFDKMTMSRGEGAMRAEFERLLPVMRAGRYVPAVDHQTPPEVSLDNYRLYLRLFREYAARAARD